MRPLRAPLSYYRRDALLRADRQGEMEARIDFPEDTSMRISHEAIYQALYVCIRYSERLADAGIEPSVGRPRLLI